MSRKSTAVLAIFGVAVIAIIMVGCEGFFVSPGSLASIKVSPSTAVLSTGGSTLTLTAIGLLVNNSAATGVVPTWAGSDNGAVVSISPTTASATTTITPVAVGNTTITATYSGQTFNVPIQVITGTVSTPQITLTGIADPGGTLQATAAMNGQSLGAAFVSWSVTASVVSSDASINTNGTVTISSTATVGETITVTGTITTNGNSTQSGTAQSTVL